jgi:phosphatidylinositol alpha-1,6-mannosyltransferase
VELLGDVEQRRSMGKRGRTWVQDEWSWDRQGERLQALFTPR